MGTRLHCLGCGNFVVESEPGMTLAIACRCGADSPILVTETGSLFSTPGSLLHFVAIEGGKAVARPEPRPLPVAMGHVERYLGYSAHASEGKTALHRMLIKVGLTPMEQCDEQRCKGDYARKRREVVDGVRPGAE